MGEETNEQKLDTETRLVFRLDENFKVAEIIFLIFSIEKELFIRDLLGIYK